MHKKYNPSNLFNKGYKYDKCYKKLDQATTSCEKKSKSQQEETITERVKLIPWKRKSPIPPILVL